MICKRFQFGMFKSVQLKGSLFKRSGLIKRALANRKEESLYSIKNDLSPARRHFFMGKKPDFLTKVPFLQTVIKILTCKQIKLQKRKEKNRLWTLTRIVNYASLKTRLSLSFLVFGANERKQVISAISVNQFLCIKITSY